MTNSWCEIAYWRVFQQRRFAGFMEFSLWMWKLSMPAVNHLWSHKIYLKINVENIEKVCFDKTVFCITVKDYNQNLWKTIQILLMSRNILKVKIENNSIKFNPILIPVYIIN